VLNKNDEVIRFLVSAGADVQAKDEDGGTPFDFAKHVGNTAVAQYLAKIAGEPFAYQSSYDNIFIAAADGSVDDVKYFVEIKNADVNAVVPDHVENWGGRTPLHCAVLQNQSVAVVEYIISQGASVNSRTKKGNWTPLHLATAKKVSVEIFACLLSHGADVNAKGDYELTPLAMGNASEEISEEKVLLLHAAMRSSGILPFGDIFEAAQKGIVDDVKHFIEKEEVNVNTKRDNGLTPLHAAAHSNPNLDVLEYLISKGADLSATVKTDDSALTLLDFATTDEKKVLLQEAMRRIGIPPFRDISAAAKEGTVDDVRYFVETKGVDVDVKPDKFGMTPLRFAAGSNSLEVVQYLVSKGADVNDKDNFANFTPFMAAAGDNSLEVVQYLVAQGANVNAVTSVGTTPLYFAAKNNSVEVVQYLISKGADVNVETNSGESPLDVADTEEKKSVLREAGGRVGSGKSLSERLSNQNKAGGSGCLVLLAALGASLTAGICGLTLLVTLGIFYAQY
jgi:ankyrin repeat protein